jgi:hypothetical protein
MVQKPNLLFLGILLTIAVTNTSAQGADVVLFLNDGREISGELLVVMDSSLVISFVSVDRKEVFEKDTVVRNQEILHVIVKGKSNILKGMGEGIIIGGGIGVLLGFLSGDDEEGFIRFTAAEKALALGVVLGGAGLIIGTIAGIASSASDRHIEPLGNRDFSILKPIARYQKSQWELLLQNIQQ